MSSRLLQKFAQYGVLSRSDTKNYSKQLTALRNAQLVTKVRKRGRVFYELTAQALSALEACRMQLRNEARLRQWLYPRRRHWYEALLTNPRFLNTRSDEAADFLFLGDWRLAEPTTESQLQLAQFRYYEQLGLTV